MLFSHLVFGRCVLNELVRRMSHFKTRAVTKATTYKNVASWPKSTGYHHRARVSGTLIERIYDES